MKHHGLLFSAPMATANVENRKTQTRRIMAGPWHWLQYHACLTGDCAHTDQSDCNAVLLAESRIQPGDTIYQKETFFDVREMRHIPKLAGVTAEAIYRADYQYRSHNDREIIAGNKWTPSIFMPQDLTRFQAEVTQIRVQSIQDITEEDAEAEGVTDWIPCGGIIGTRNRLGGGATYQATHVEAYRILWNTLNLPPAPVYGPKDKFTEKRPIIRYDSFPWSLEDFHKSYPSNSPDRWRGLPLNIIPNPYVWAITYKRLP
jgi:hypothetical protein